MGTTEQKLIENFINGDSRSFTAVYDALAPFLLSLARKLTADPVLADEVVQQAFITLFQRRDKLEAQYGLASIRAYMATSVRNEAFHIKRRRNSQLTIVRDIDETLPVAQDPEVFHAEIEAECFARWRSKIAALTPAEKRVFELVIVDARTPEEASEILNVSKKRIDNMRARINGLLRPRLPILAGVISLALVIIRWLTEKL